MARDVEIPEVTLPTRSGNRLRCTLMGIAVSAGLLGCGSSDIHQKVGADFVRPVRWHLASRPKNRTVELAMAVPFCVYTMAVPRVQRVEKVERRGETLIKVFVHFKDLPNLPEGIGCADTERGLFKTVRLRRAVKGQLLSDSAVSPPAIRWPPLRPLSRSRS